VLKKVFEEKKESLCYADIVSTLNEKKEEKKPSVKVTLNEKRLYEYFEPDTSVEMMQSVILELLEGYKSGKITLQSGDYADVK
jgi:hypothetical protein